jgi:hypothetical protein
MAAGEADAINEDSERGGKDGADGITRVCGLRSRWTR